MTERSLGLLRSSSYGLLPKQPSAHKPSKMERLIQRICKAACRRKFGMSLLVIASVAVILSLLYFVSRDEYVSRGPQAYLTSSYHFRVVRESSREVSNSLRPSVIHSKYINKVNTTAMPKHELLSNENKIQPPSPFISMHTVRARHPCESFSLPPPPPADKKRTGPRPCPVCYVPVEQAMALMPAFPSVSPLLKNLTFISEENLIATESIEGSAFGGHPSLQQRNEYFDIKESMTVHCGFVKGKKPGSGTGFDIDDADLLEMEQCHGVVVASAIFGNYDVMQQPKNISEAAKESACFYMFVDEETEASIKNFSTLDSAKEVGLWRVVVVRNLPYVDARRNGKVPKLLLHRIFPNARFSIWIDGKLELVVDPYKILERFLWRKNASFAISRHYRRYDVFEEAEANKAAGKYDNASIDYQIEFYRREGLTHYSPSKLPITSDVPEGCVIIREHTPISSLFTCLWFNEVERFTARDQISFSTVRDKIMSKVNWSVDMFKDCERRNFVVQAHHRDLLEHMNPPPATLSYPPPRQSVRRGRDRKSMNPPPATLSDPPPRQSVRHVRDRKSGSRRHHPGAANDRDRNSILS